MSSEWPSSRGGILLPPSVVPRAAPVAIDGAVAVLSGRPAYALGAGVGGTSQILGVNTSHALLGQFYQAIPVLRRAVGILAGLVGAPEYRTGSDTLDADLLTWSRGIPFGRIGMGLSAWLADHIAQALVYGYAVGEVEIARPRGFAALWSYHSATCAFRVDQSGQCQIVQRGRMAQEVLLNPQTMVSTTYDPVGSDPRGQSLFLCVPTAAQLWMDMLYAYRSTWRRCGIATFHVNWQPGDSFDDPTGAVGSEVRQSLQDSWSNAMKSQAVDGVPYDFFSTGAVTVEPVGAKTAIMDLQPAKRAIVEELVTATGIPPWMLGYTWSTTERLSQQQADMLVSFVEAIRRSSENALLKIGSLRERLQGRSTELAIAWPDVTLQDRTEQAVAAKGEAEAAESRERYATALWKSGVWNQGDYAEHLTGQTLVRQTMAEPPAAPVPVAAPAEERPAGRNAAKGDYPDLHRCKVSADDPDQLFPVEEPEYAALAAATLLLWRKTSERFAELAASWQRAVRVSDAGVRLNLTLRSQETFLRAFVGRDLTLAGFIAAETEDGLLQQAELLAHRTGQLRATELIEALPVPTPPALPPGGSTPALPGPAPISSVQRTEILTRAYERLSEDGRLRFADRLEEIRQAMEDGLRDGTPADEVARNLSADLDGYEAGRLRTIVRTEMALGSERALREELQSRGTQYVRVKGNPLTDAACTLHIGKVYRLDDRDSLPIYHPNCFCTVEPVAAPAGDSA